MSAELYVVLRWNVGSFERHQLVFYAGTTNIEAKEVAKVIRELATKIGIGGGIPEERAIELIDKLKRDFVAYEPRSGFLKLYDSSA